MADKQARRRIPKLRTCRGCEGLFAPISRFNFHCPKCRVVVCDECSRKFEVAHNSRVKPENRRFCSKECKTSCRNRFAYANNKESFLEYYRTVGRQRRLKENYGLTLSDYEAMYASQNALCAICDKPEPTPGKLLNVDHDHAPGKIRRLLCTKCNCGLGNFLDNENLLLKAAEYLTQHRR